MVRLAVFSDVHSNLPALEAVLADIEAVGVDRVYCLGDLVGYAPFPNEVCALVRERGIETVITASYRNTFEGLRDTASSSACRTSKRTPESGVFLVNSGHGWRLVRTVEGSLERLQAASLQLFDRVLASPDDLGDLEHAHPLPKAQP
jgi:hypothetical protein